MRPLWKHLIFDVHRGCSRMLQYLYRVHDVKRVAPPCADIRHQRQSGCPSDIAGGDGHILRGKQWLGNGQVSSEGITSEPDRLEAQAFGDPSCQAIVYDWLYNNGLTGQKWSVRSGPPRHLRNPTPLASRLKIL